MATNFITPKFKLDPNADKYFIKKITPSPTPPTPSYEIVTITPSDCGSLLIIDENNNVFTTTVIFEDIINTSYTTSLEGYNNIEICEYSPDQGLDEDIKVVIK